jgi:5'-nucleotidase
VRVLLSNDDGIHAAGLLALAQAFEGHEVWTVAPDREQSAQSHAITLARPLRMTEVDPRRFAVDGTPTDAVYLGLNEVLKSQRPDVVVSGVNHGFNLGDDIFYSGTVAAAMEGALLGIHAIAVSLADGERDFGHVARFAASLADRLVSRPPPAPTLLNINAPGGPIRGYRFCRLGHRSYGSGVSQNRDPRGKPYYWIGGSEATSEETPGTDCHCVCAEKLVSVTPLHLDATHHPMLEELRNWTVAGFEKVPLR